MATLQTLVRYLDGFLKSELYSDNSMNGLQVEGKQDVRTIGLAVDSGLSIIEQAIKKEVDMLIVHHGLFWGELEPIVGPLQKKLSLLIKNECSLYASHLPLDGNSDVGNGFELARFLALESIEPFCQYKGAYVGARGICNSKSIEFFIEKASNIHGSITPLVFPFGSKEIKKVAVVTGSGSFALRACREQQIDLLVSGEPKQEAYHMAKELGVNAIFAGHYATETFGVKALGKRLEKDFDVSTVFIDEPTGV